MPMLFNPLRLRQAFDECILDMALSTQDDRSPAMGNIAIARIGDVIDAWLIGLESRVAPVLPRALSWIDRAIHDGEDFGTSLEFHRLRLMWARALGTWMHTGKDDSAAWDAVRVQSLITATDSRAYSPDQLPTDWLDDHLAFCVLAGRFHEGVAEYERRCGDDALALGQVRHPREAGYAYCLREVRGAFESARLFDAGRRLLAAHLEDTWLGRGQKLRAAMWLAVVYRRHGSSSTPLEVILRAYENMPHVSRPVFATS